MLLAHGGEGGANLEALILAVPMVILGIIFFVQKTAKPIVSIALILGGFAIGIGGFTLLSGDDDDAAGASSPDKYVGAVLGLCEARRLAPSDPGAASDHFFDEAHVPLHDLASEVGETDRAEAATLLETKQTVEGTLESEDLDGDALEDDLSQLLDATITSLRAIDVEAPTC